LRQPYRLEACFSSEKCSCARQSILHGVVVQRACYRVRTRTSLSWARTMGRAATGKAASSPTGQASNAWVVAESEKITKQSHLGSRCWRALLLGPALGLAMVSSVSRPYPSADLIRLVLRFPLFLPLLGRFALRILFLNEEHLWVAGIKVQESTLPAYRHAPCCSARHPRRNVACLDGRARCRFRLAGQSRGHQQNLIGSGLEVFWL
jgi:hypothetical protein